jgi:hypothetical protein
MMEKNHLPHATPKKDASPDPKISKDELPEGDLNKVTGGKVRFDDFKIVKPIDKPSTL